MASVVGLDSAGLVDLSLWRFFLWGVPVLLASIAPGPIRRWAGRTLRMPLLEDRRVMRMTFYGQRHHRLAIVRPTTFTDDELASLSVPVRIVAGEKSEMIPASKVKARLARINPAIEVDVVPDAGHALPVSHRERCIEHVTHATL